jgi:hypothetical protein
MSVSESSNVEGLLDQLKGWPSSDRLRLARMILETLEGGTPGGPPRPRSLKDILGLLETGDTPPTDEECQALLEEELAKKHLR